jgi:hypothetical protein
MENTASAYSTPLDLMIYGQDTRFVGASNVKCNRCSGVMIHERFFDSNEPFFSWRCLACGEVVDQTILENRDHQSHGGEWDKRGKKWERSCQK